MNDTKTTSLTPEERELVIAHIIRGLMEATADGRFGFIDRVMRQGQEPLEEASDEYLVEAFVDRAPDPDDIEGDDEAGDLVEMLIGRGLLPEFEVRIEGIGAFTATYNEGLACAEFMSCVSSSASSYGPASEKAVFLLRDGEEIDSYYPNGGGPGQEDA